MTSYAFAPIRTCEHVGFWEEEDVMLVTYPSTESSAWFAFSHDEHRFQCKKVVILPLLLG